MSDEEKEALVELKHFSNKTAYWKQEEYTNSEIDNYIKIVLNLIEKQSKEIEGLKKKKFILNTETGEIKEIPVSDNYISKDKIKAKIEIRKEEKENCKDSIEEKYLLREIYVLQSLLEEE